MGCKRPEVQILSPRLMGVCCKAKVSPSWMIQILSPQQQQEEPSCRKDGFILFLRQYVPGGLSECFMEIREQPVSSITNTQSIISLVFGVLTALSFCAGLLPIPLTGWVCFPVSLVLGGAALIFGVASLNRIRRRNESGRPMAWIGIIIGGAVFLCVLCMVIAFASLFIFAPHSLPTPPFIDKYL